MTSERMEKKKKENVSRTFEFMSDKRPAVASVPCVETYFPSIISDVIDQIGRSHDRVARSAAIDNVRGFYLTKL